MSARFLRDTPTRARRLAPEGLIALVVGGGAIASCKMSD